MILLLDWRFWSGAMAGAGGTLTGLVAGDALPGRPWAVVAFVLFFVGAVITGLGAHIEQQEAP